MIRKSLTAVAAGVLTLGLALGAPVTAHAKVTGKDALAKADIVKQFSGLKNGQFSSSKPKQVGVPAKKCGKNTSVKVKSGYSLSGATTSTSAVSGVFEFKSAKQAKNAMAKYKKYVKKCKSFKVAGFTVKLSKDKAPKVGQDRVAMTGVTNYGSTKAYASSVIIRHGKRVATVGVSGTQKVNKKKLNKLAKVAAKKMK